MTITGVYNLQELKEAIARSPANWRPLVFTNGCFDLLHVGHIRYLNQAKSYGRSLVVGLNSDQSVQQIKPQELGKPSRPIIPAEQRAEILLGLKAVDAVVIFEETTATATISELQPDIYVKGGDYTVATLPEASTVKSYGGKISLIQVEIPTSTSGIIQRILELR